MISLVDPTTFSIWSHSEHMLDLYRSRAKDFAEEMTCAAQCAEIIAGVSSPGDSLLDVGCGSGWFAHSLRKRGLQLTYWGIDKCEGFIEIARREHTALGISEDQLICGDIENAIGLIDHVVCMNVLSNISNWHAALDRMASIAAQTIVLRESLGSSSSYRYVLDQYLDPGVDLRVHVNRYSIEEICAFLGDRGFTCRIETDRRTGGVPESVIGYDHYWMFLVASRSVGERP